MLFHVTAEHDHMTCPGREGGIGSDEVKEFQKWMEGNDEVKVLGQWSHQPIHKSFAIYLEVSHLGDVGVFQLGGQVRLPPKGIQVEGLTGVPRVHDLQGHHLFATQIDGPLPATGQGL